MTFDLKLAPIPFAKIKSGKKVIEMRLNDERRKDIRKGDMIRFTNQDTLEVLMAEVLDIKGYKDFFELYEAYLKSELGYESNEINDPEDMYIYYSKQRIDKYGVLAIRIKVQ